VGAVPRSSSSEFPGTANASSGVTVPVATTKAAEADVSHIEHIDISASADARPAISAPTPAASTYDANTQSRTEIATEQAFIRRSKRGVKRSVEIGGNTEVSATSSKRAKR
jgi:hypothetical protein